jgi:orotidine-5'-phosphate decarboxylase
MLNRDRLIVALDVPSATQARQLVQSIGESASTYKIGKQLFTAEGPQIVRDLVSSGRKVFLDLKFHDIPNTVAAAVRQAAELQVSMLTVHASGGSKMLKAAADAAAQSAAKPMILAVTVLTSLSDADLSEIGISGNVMTQVLRLGALARNAGCGGLVASAKEAAELRRELGEDFAIVTPGIRPSGPSTGGPYLPSVGKCGETRTTGTDDQARVLTPKEAIAAGATYLVVGRPILEATDPSQAAQNIAREIDEALSVTDVDVGQRV